MSSIRRCDGCGKIIEATDTWKQFEAVILNCDGMHCPATQRSRVFDFCTYACLMDNALNAIASIK